MKRLATALCLWLSMNAGPIHAACTAANTYRFSFAGQAAATLAYGSTYGYTAATSGGATRPFNVAIAQNGMSSTVAGGVQMPAIGTLVTGPDATQRDLILGGTFGGRTATLGGTTRTASVTFTFAQPVRDFAMVVHDVDFTSNQFRDWVSVSGSSAAGTYVPALVTPVGNGNGAAQPRTASGSSVTVGQISTPLSLSADQAAGNGGAGNNSDTGTITASFAEPVTSVTMRYGNYPFVTGEAVTGQQAIGIAGISFCPMPAVSVSKASAPAAQTLGAFNLPAFTIIYTITVSNSGGSPADAGSIRITDVLPASLVFRNEPFDATTSLPVKISGLGLTLSSTDIAFSSNDGASWSYAPAAGPDPAVRGIRIIPSGILDAGASATLTFAVVLK